MLKLNKIYLGDCLEIMKEIDDNSIDSIICDLPYGTTSCKWDNVIQMDKLWEQYVRIIKDNSAIVLFGCQPFASSLINSKMDLFKYEWIWQKNKYTGFLNSKIMPLRAHENILIFGKGKINYNPQKTTGHKPVNNFIKHSSDGETVGKTKLGISGGGSTERFPVSILKFDVVNQDGSSPEGKYHPTQKPIKLLEYLIKTYSSEKALILDNCIGSGSTAIACINTKRNFIGIEKDEKYFNIACKRIESIN